MAAQDARTNVLSRIEALNAAMPEFRKVESTVKGLKAEVAAANVRIGASDPEIGSAQLSRLIQEYLMAW